MTKLEKDEPEDIPLTLRQLGALFGVAPGTVKTWVGDGPDNLKRGDDGKIMLSEAGRFTRQIQVTKIAAGRGREPYPYAPKGWGPLEARVVIPPPPGDPSVQTKDQVDIRLREAQAIKIETENDVTAGRLIPLDEVDGAWRTILSRVRTQLLRLPGVLSPLVHGDPDVLSIQKKLKDGVADALREASEDWRDEVKGTNGDE